MLTKNIEQNDKMTEMKRERVENLEEERKKLEVLELDKIHVKVD